MSSSSPPSSTSPPGGDDPAKVWFPYVRRLAQPRHRLVCMHHAGGSAAAFRPWIGPLAGHGIEVWALQLPGRENRWGERPFEDMATAARSCVAALLPHIDVPYTLLGHSVGAKLAFATAQLLAATDAPAPARLVLSATPAPSCPEDDTSIRHDQPRDELLAGLQRMGGTRPELLAHPDFLDLLLPVLRADLRLNDSARRLDLAAIDVPVSVFGGLDDDVTRDELAAWLPLTRVPGRLEQLPGGHFFLFAAENRMPERLARLIGSDL